ncbi:uncharacterized protein VNE69_06060 [Vairimorpha necatrix]|uniref:Uncharacterized protein n=1 Tax=Vairimorpha necatrix TaxID=6039 RepID=A0AAX4JCL0_9MICR
MKQEDFLNNLDKETLGGCIANSYDLLTLSSDKIFNTNIEKDLFEILSTNFSTIKNSEKKFLKNKNLKVLFNNLSHLILGNDDWNKQNKEEAARLLYGINYWVIKEGGPYVTDFIILNDFHVDIVFLFIQLFDKFV